MKSFSENKIFKSVFQRKFILLLPLLFSFEIGIASQATDSLLKILKTQKLSLKEKCILYGDIAWEFTDVNLDSAEIFAKKEMSLAKKINDKGRYCDALNTLGIISQNRSDFRAALDYYHTALKEFKKVKDTAWIASLYNNIAIVYQFQHNYKLALKYCREGLKTYQLTDDSIGIANSYANIGLSYAYLKDYENAHRYYDTTIILQKKNKNYHGVANTYVNWGSIYVVQNNIEAAEEMFIKAMEAADKNEYPHAYFAAMGNLGQMKAKKGKIEEALKLCHESIVYAEKFSISEILSTDCNCLYEAYKAKGEYKTAIHYLERWTALKDSSNNQQLTAELSMKDAEFNYSLRFSEDSLQHVKEKELDDIKNNAELDKKQTIQYALFGILGLTFVFAIFIFNRFRAAKKQKEIIELKERETHLQKQIIEEKNKEIIDSINYAKRIQYTLLAHDEFLQQNLHQHFIFFLPKDIVSGDFYWSMKKENDFYLAVCDCTGHGVPGAFMSLLNISLLNEAVSELNIKKPNEILNFVRDKLSKTMEGSKDGMDCILIRLKDSKLEYAAAHNRPVLIRKQQLIELSTDKMPVGISDKKESFSHFETDLMPGDQLYLYTDGYADQFGGEKGKKFKYSNLHHLLLKISDKSSSEQKSALEESFHAWKRDLEQVDDICIMGISIK